MNEVNESDSGLALESVVQLQQDCDVASNPTVQSTALTIIEQEIEDWLIDAGHPWVSKRYCQGAIAALNIVKTKLIEHEAKCNAVD